MSAQLQELARIRPMEIEDLDAVMRVEDAVYAFPWTRGNFKDSLAAGYGCWVLEHAGQVIGHAVLMVAVEEAHILNLSVAKEWQQRGFGRRLLEHLLAAARGHHARFVYLEVRPSNVSALRLYYAAGFREIALRRRYYPSMAGREDAMLLGRPL